MIEVFYIGQGDTLPSYNARVRNKDGVASLSDVLTVYFTMARISTASVVVSAVASVLETSVGDIGKIRYQWAIADTSSLGEFAASFLFVTSNKQFTLPRNEVAKVVVESRYPSASE